MHLLHKVPSRKFYNIVSSIINKSNRGVIITLHRVTLQENKESFNNFIEITQNQLERVILELKKLNAGFVSLSEMEKKLTMPTGKKVLFVHFSFDDGYLDNYSLAYPVLKKHNIPFSIFVASDFIENKMPFTWWYLAEQLISKEVPVAFEKYQFFITGEDYRVKEKEDIFIEFREMMLKYYSTDSDYFEQQFALSGQSVDFKYPEMLTWSQLREMCSSGLCEIGNHTASHARFSILDTQQKKVEIQKCRDDINNNLGIASPYFAYPYGSNEDIGERDGVAEILKECGIRMAFTTNAEELNNHTDKYFLPRVFLNNATTGYTLRTRLNGTYQRKIR